MFLRRKRQKGFMLLSLLMAIMIIGVLTNTYMTMEGPDGKTFVQSTQDRARHVVTIVNLRTAQTQFFMETEGRNLPPDQLRTRMDALSRQMGNGGRFFVDQNMNVQNTLLLETPLFQDKLKDIPRIR
jgi:Tfp pilus assembly protein PilE